MFDFLFVWFFTFCAEASERWGSGGVVPRCQVGAGEAQLMHFGL